MSLVHSPVGLRDGGNNPCTECVAHHLIERVPLLIRLDDNSITPAQGQSISSEMAPSRTARAPYVEAEGDEIRVRNPLGSCREVYLRTASSSVLVGSTLEEVLEKGTNTPAPEKIVAHLNNDRALGFSVWRDVHVIPAGGVAHLQRGGALHIASKLDSMHDVSNAAGDPAAILEELLQRESLTERFGVSFSGGCDSTSLLFAAAAVYGVEQPVACTWYFPGGSAHDDAKIASAIADELGVEHFSLTLSEDLLFRPIQRPLPAAPSTALAFQAVIYRLAEELSIRTKTRPVTILDGHGGDHIFLDPVPVATLRGTLRRQPSVFARKLSHYAQLYSVSYIRVLRAMVKTSPNPVNKFLRKEVITDFHQDRPSLTAVRNESLRRALMQDAISENSYRVICDERAQYLRPFTQDEMLRYALSLPTDALYDQNHTRLPFRQKVAKHYNTTAVFRRRKGSVTGAFQKALWNNRAYLEALVLEGQLAQWELIDRKRFREVYNQTALGCGGFDHDLLKLLTTALLIDAYQRLL
ncbi:asparagine synthase-related protein [Aidingimonas halophila]|uniref:Asparagine synthase n=1 Tax=Aidingimonas halophila TaxID=574349 RepID=A0A1H3A118_9GAMM|nr:asparagine synthase-related protein [Aidingimonas halophila]SDX23273.1 Asparagine synthase [Aidingimonas halophila]